jgi:hypothetical protein
MLIVALSEIQFAEFRRKKQLEHQRHHESALEEEPSKTSGTKEI